MTPGCLTHLLGLLCHWPWGMLGRAQRRSLDMTKVRTSSSETKGIGQVKEFGEFETRRMTFCKFQLLLSFFSHSQEEFPPDYNADQHGQNKAQSSPSKARLGWQVGEKNSLTWLDFSSTFCGLNVPFRFQTMTMSKFLMAVGEGGEGTLLAWINASMDWWINVIEEELLLKTSFLWHVCSAFLWAMTWCSKKLPTRHQMKARWQALGLSASRTISSINLCFCEVPNVRCFVIATENKLRH